jgi:TatD DNase family protein
MAADAHAHPRDLIRRFPGAEAERRRLGAACAASAWGLEEFECHEALARRSRAEGAAPFLLCFAVHPQLPAGNGQAVQGSLETLAVLAAEGRLDAVGETGFDLYNDAYRATEGEQESLFAAHLEIAAARGLPLVLHLRRAMHKVFAHGGALRKLPAVVFHSYPGTLAEGKALLRRGINGYFSFGTPLLLNHKTAMAAWAGLPAERLLLETDAPYQPLRGRAFSSWADLPAILAGGAALRRAAGAEGGGVEELEALTDANFRRVFGEGDRGGRPW